MKNFKNIEFIIYDGLVLFYEHCFSFNIFETVMEKYFKRKLELELLPSTKRVENSSSKQDRVEINLANLPSDPRLRPRITDYHPNDHDQDQVRRAYAQRVLANLRNIFFHTKHMVLRTDGSTTVGLLNSIG
jgi:hypothetical protein